MTQPTLWDEILPRPVAIEPHPGALVITGGLKVAGTAGFATDHRIDLPGLLGRANEAVRRLTRRGSDFFTLIPPGDGVDVVFEYVSDGDGAPSEGAIAGAYRLTVTPLGITVGAADQEGFAGALSTLVQAIMVAEDGDAATSTAETRAIRSGGGSGGSAAGGSADDLPGPCTLPAATIADHPAEEWRGFMFDVARHFFPIKSLQRMVDILWLLRLNRFHLHLTDDQGWRLPVPEYPRLTEVGGWRSDETSERGRYGGCYSRDELRRLDADAAALGITIVPEIDLPGHASAAVTAYPEASCDGEAPGVETRWGIFPAVVCATSRAARDLLTAAYRAVADTFSGRYIHIGGDEVLPEKWARCPDCSREDDPYQTIVRFMAEAVISLGRRPVAWDEAAGLDLPRETIIINWRDASGARAALERGYDLILAPEGRAAYLDHKHLKDPLEPGRLSFGTVADSAAFAPRSYVAAKAGTARTGSVLGGQGNLWSEEILYHRHFEYMAIVRLAALAQGFWSGVPADRLPEFFTVLGRWRRRLGDRGLAVYPGPYTNEEDRATLSPS
jgi:hexosaminidase